MSEYYLAHHGIKGQKWGVRRYQNADGSLTNAGRKHYELASDIKNHHFRAAKIPERESSGGGGGEPMEDWEKRMYDDIEKTLEQNPGLFTYDQLTNDDWQSFKLTLAEFAGIDTDKLSSAQIEAMRKKVQAHYKNAK